MKNTVLSLLRHLLTFGGGLILANNPDIAPASVEQGIGLVTTLVGLSWGMLDEYKAEKAAK